MSTFAKGVIRDTLIQLIGRGLSATITLLFTLYLARHLGSFYFGEYTKVIAYITLFYMGIDFGLNPVFLRLTNGHIASNVATLLKLRMLMAVGLSVLSVLLALTLIDLHLGFEWTSLPGVAISSLAIVGYALIMTHQVAFQARLKFWPSVLAQILGNATSLLMVLLVFSQVKTEISQVYWALFATSLGLVVSGGVGWIWLAKLVQLKQKIDISWKKLLLQSWPLGATLIANVIYFRIDSLILAASRGNMEVGVYGLAYRFFELILVLPTFIMNSLYPRLLSGSKDGSFQSKTTLIILITFFSLGLIVSGVTWWGAPYVGLIKRDYVSSVELLRVLAISLPIFFLTSPLMWLYVLRGNQKQLLYIYLVGLVFNVGANLSLVSMYGATASAWITGATEVLVLILGVVFLKKYVNTQTT